MLESVTEDKENQQPLETIDLAAVQKVVFKITDLSNEVTDIKQIKNDLPL